MNANKNSFVTIVSVLAILYAATTVYKYQTETLNLRKQLDKCSQVLPPPKL